MLQIKTTPVPNVFFDVHLRTLNLAELKILLVIIRKTLGWTDKYSHLGRKEMDWISGSQLQQITGCSRRAISSATELLVKKKLIEVLDEMKNLLCNSQMRKGKQRLYYRISGVFCYGDKQWKMGLESNLTDSTTATFAQDLSKKVSALAQKMRITKETLQN